MTQSLTIADAKKIARSKQFHMPVQYDNAVKALHECTTLDESKEFTNAAEALAVWAKMYQNNEALRQAKQLKLHAHRRMGELARELAPGKNKVGGGREPGPLAKLQEYGLSRHQADAASVLASLKKRDFNKLINQKSPPAPTSVAKRFRDPGTTTQWKLLRQSQHNPFVCQAFINNNTPASIARKLNKGEVQYARKLALELIDWLDEFEQRLPQTDD